MNNEISKLEPVSLWENFYALTQIPRPSKKEKKAADYIVEFGKNLGLETLVDDIGNVIIKKPATPGMENRKTVVLQGHIDMVPQKNSDKVHDFEKDPIETHIEDGWVTANGTTLGADNGIGVAAAMTVLQSKKIQHGPIEALFTIDEETGMTGAFGLKPGLLAADILLNMDSEDEGELYVGCAGGSNANMTFDYKEVETNTNTVAFKISLTGLKGGHSGMDIVLGRGNANKLMFRLLKEVIAAYGVRLSSIDGGSLRNAIPREAFAIVTVPSNNVIEFTETIEEFAKIYQNELAATEPSLSLMAEKCEMPSSLIDELSQDDLVNAIQACPNGVIRMSDSMKGLVETSLNLAIVKSEDKKISVMCLIRGSVDSAKEDVESTLESLFRLAGAQVEFSGQYPGWKPNPQSEILTVMKEVYHKEYGKTPAIKGIHAGLECGILGAAYPNWDMISFGPTIRSPHSPDEKVNIETVEKFWHFLVETLKNIPTK
ncbi:aminoacyl-histidine dipeptidase [Saccharicrinis fermentans]|uniref:Cytosol non-specific dipeptidase n=1 Tax=Saccharicrinis fermentans DSM 9555 = JCM 21142 TaxID=869213 RepID=W7YFZ2_9BACT|nr:aminoacyl-histidine dipeptidase [Saccharicrinis fermentans]GAF01514.1 cytosol non-specific dipeptidase [Saccharicrinis fermentans DSM 9555 = JCM 21142]